MNLLFILVVMFLYNTESTKGQFSIPKIPKKINPIQDYVGILSSEEVEKLNQKLISYSKKTSTEILVTIIQDLHGEDPNFLAMKWGEKWKIGKLQKNNGIIILLSINDKKISIQNGYGIEPYLTDLSTTKIINKVKPLLKNNFYYQAIDSSTQEIFKILQGKFQKERQKKTIQYRNYFSYILLLFIIYYILFFKKLGNFSLLKTLFFIDFIFPTLNENLKDDENKDDFDNGFGGGGNFGGGGSSENW
ncbi:TPM domain-containing protein [Blattabacterium cuenoti]|uniref:TPM domain-containing protein n=1 Tax=Blattabacterium cuenoti TaxID=1653831 RepID=UPI001EECD227|nr:TPM domain-containing protein [Blattabacterium cuenoti]